MFQECLCDEGDCSGKILKKKTGTKSDRKLHAALL
ncbi:hypothetical protein T02_1856 [Trichinella nativa]|uniref:Uncharacterized protein n=1 Tax=Trichinella nativa TaxID=6335 RepID=A0A0V1KH05_9BILA|nr:hypothetical protein T02_1856 [Trichinella nativa]